MVTYKPAVLNDIITEVMASGPRSKGKVNGTTPVSSLESPTPNRHPPCVKSSMDKINRSIPPAIMKLCILIPNIESI